MDTVVFACISLILLIPLIYFLPLPFTIKGKGIVIASAFIVAIMGLLGCKIYPLWLVGLFGILLLFFITYLIGKNMDQFVLSTSEEGEVMNNNSHVDSNLFSDKFYGSTPDDTNQRQKNDQRLRETNIVPKEEYIPELDFIEEKKEIPRPSQNLEEKDHSVELEKMEDLLEAHEENNEQTPSVFIEGSDLSEIEKLLEGDIEIKELEEIELNNKEVAAAEEPLKIEELDKEEDWLGVLENEEEQPMVMEDSDLSEIEKLLEGDIEIKEPEEIELNNKEVAAAEEPSKIEELDKEEDWLGTLENEEKQPMVMEDSDLSEIEKLLEEDIEIKELEEIELSNKEVAATEEPLKIEELDKEEDWLGALENEEGQPIVMEDSDLSEIEKLLEGDIEIKELEEIELSNKEAAVAEETSVLEELIEEVDWLEELENDETAEQPIVEKDTSFLEMEKFLEEDIEVKDTEELEKAESVNEPNSHLQTELYKTMLLQVQLAKGKMEAEQYERFVQGYLHPDLGDEEYASFAFYLIQHYIDERKVTDLEALLLHLKERFNNYPVLIKELDFIENCYVNKKDIEV